MADDQTPEAEIVTVPAVDAAVDGAVGVLTLGRPALSRAAKEQLLARQAPVFEGR
jgi:hypothetical protein